MQITLNFCIVFLQCIVVDNFFLDLKIQKNILSWFKQVLTVDVWGNP